MITLDTIENGSKTDSIDLIHVIFIHINYSYINKHKFYKQLLKYNLPTYIKNTDLH